MKRTLTKLITAVLAFFALATTSCRELAQNGDFSGQWQVLTMEYPDGSTVNVQGQRYYCIYRDVAQLTAPGGTMLTGNLTYDEDAGRFSIQFPHETAAKLAPWGIEIPEGPDNTPDGCTARFVINTLTSQRLVMTGETGIVITCRKY